MRLIYAMLLGFILDLIIGDPHGLIHPVQIIGWFIDKLKKGMQHMIYGCSNEEVREKEIERKAGVEKTAGFFLMLFIKDLKFVGNWCYKIAACCFHCHVSISFHILYFIPIYQD